MYEMALRRQVESRWALMTPEVGEIVTVTLMANNNEEYKYSSST